MRSNYNIFGPSRLYLINENFEEDDDWETHFAFNTCNHHKGLNLHGLKFPPRLRDNKMGSYCVEWLKRFCQTFGLEYIVLGAYSDAKGFWRKMGFEEISRDRYRYYLGINY